MSNTTIGDLINIRTGKLDANAAVKDGKYPFFTTAKEISRIDNFSYEGEVVLVAGNGDLNVKYYHGKFDAYQRTYILSAKNDTELEMKYLYYFFENYLKVLRSQSIGGVIKYIKLENLTTPKVYFPSIKKQKRIAETLDLALDLIEKRKEQIAEMDKLIQSIFFEMFLVSENKKMEKLRDYEEFLTSGSRGWAKYYSDKGSYFITIKNVKNTRLNFEKPTFVNPPDTKEAQRTRVKENDLLISITADLGRTAVVTKEIADFGGFINQHLSLIRLSKQINPTFLSHYFESEYGKRQFERLDQNGVKSGLNFDAIRNLEFPIFPIELQNKFASIVEEIESQKKVMEESLHEMENNFSALMQKAFRGELFPEE